MLSSTTVKLRRSYITDVARQIADKKLDYATPVIGSIEAGIKKALFDLRLDACYHFFPFPTDDVQWHEPDFLVLGMRVNGKPVIIDPHHFREDENGIVKKSDIERFRGYKDIWGRDFHIVHVSSYFSEERVKAKTGMVITDFAHEALWAKNHGTPVSEIAKHMEEKILNMLEEKVDREETLIELADILRRAERGRDLQRELHRRLTQTCREEYPIIRNAH